MTGKVIPEVMKAERSRTKRFAELIAEASACRICPELCERRAVLSELNGSPGARILFIGEAPGRQGADRTRIPFSGDQSGRNFDRFLASIGLTRDRIFITSAVLCNPRGPTGANRSPKQSEIENCSSFLRRAIELVDPQVVVTLGSVALAALKRIEYHQFTVKADAGRVCGWSGRVLVPLYHPSPQVLASHRRDHEQLADYQAVAEALQKFS
jgi:uracil-DNA glycosylase family 4